MVKHHKRRFADVPPDAVSPLKPVALFRPKISCR